MLRTINLFIIFVLIIFSACSCNRINSMRICRKAKAESDVSKKIELYTNAIKSYPNGSCGTKNKGGTYLKRGSAYVVKNNYDAAIEDYTMAIKINSKFATAYLFRAYPYELKGEFDKAIKDYDMVIELEPRNPQHYFSRGNVYLRTGDYEEAINDFDKAIKLRDTFELAYLMRAQAYYNNGDYDNAIKDSNKKIEFRPHGPNSTDAYFIKGYSYYYKGNYEQAIKNLKKGVEISEKYKLVNQKEGVSKHIKMIEELIKKNDKDKF